MGEATHIVCPHCDTVNRLPSQRLNKNGKCGRCKAPLFISKPIELKGSNFNQHISRCDLPVVVDFWAPWCGPCKMMAPIFEKAAQLFEPQIRLAKVNTEVEQGLAATWNIRSIPTIVLFKGGHEVNRVAGAMDLNNLTGWIKQSL